MAMEYELKFAADAQVQQAVLQAFAGDFREYRMETTYYDTPSGALSARRYTLRMRLENGRSVCTLKTPGVGAARGEWETEAADISSGVSILCKLGVPEELPRLLQEGLVPICGARFTRRAKTLVLPEGTAELALDQGVLIGGGRETPLCEIEVELKSGETACCDRFAKELADTYGLKIEPDSKFCRALRLYKGE